MPDNLNTPFLPETASEATVHLRSDLSLAGTLDVAGVTTLAAALDSASAVSAGVATLSGLTLSGDINLQGNRVLSILTQSASGTASNMTDGEFQLSAVSDLGAIIAWRSGDTVYLFESTGTAS